MRPCFKKPKWGLEWVLFKKTVLRDSAWPQNFHVAKKTLNSWSSCYHYRQQTRHYQVLCGARNQGSQVLGKHPTSWATPPAQAFVGWMMAAFCQWVSEVGWSAKAQSWSLLLTSRVWIRESKCQVLAGLKRWRLHMDSAPYCRSCQRWNQAF